MRRGLGLTDRQQCVHTCRAVLGLALLLTACGPPVRQTSDHFASTSAATAEGRTFIRSLRVAGTVEAVQSFTVSVPRLAGPLGTLVVTRLVRSGVRVAAGDPLIEFDRQAQFKTALDRKAEYLDFVAQISKKRAEQDAARVHDDSELKQAGNGVARAKLEMLKNEMLSAIAAERNQQALEESIARLKQLQDGFDLKRRAAAAELRVLEIQRDRAREAMLHAEQNAERMTIAAALSGLVVLKTVWKGEQMAEVQEGEEVRAGMPVLELVDTSAMRVRARINQADVPYLKIGQHARIHLDAYPSTEFSGTLTQLSPVGSTSVLSARVRTFVALFSVDGQDPTLLPDLSAAVDVELERLPHAIVVPRDAITLAGQRATATVRRGMATENRYVTIGPMGDHEVVVTSGLSAGDTVVRQQPRKGGG